MPSGPGYWLARGPIRNRDSIGHPNIPSVQGATVAEDDFQKESANPLLRAKALLKAVTEFSTLPPTNQCISVSNV